MSTAITETQKGKQSLYSITTSLESFTLKQEDVQTETIYGANMIRVEKDLELGLDECGKGKRIMLKAGKGITFGSGFRVKIGASLICITGF